MKKFFVYISSAISCFFLLLLIVSCENFLSGSLLKNDLDDAIDYANAPFAKILLTSEGAATASLIPAAGNYDEDYKVGDSFTIKFEPREEYNFIKWLATPASAISFSKASELETVVKIKDATNPIIISPYCVLRDRLYIDFAWDQGSVSVDNFLSGYQNEVFKLRYNEVPDYAFIRWYVTDNLTGEEITDVLDFDVNQKETNVRILKTDLKVTVKAITAKRPKVVSSSPIYDTNGVYRDRRIIIMFDKEMDDSVIYWTANELEEMGVSLENATAATNKFDKKGNQYYYKYWDGSNPNSITYKNVKITKLENEELNLLQYYGMPVFDALNPRFLQIPTVVGNPPPVSINILVTVSENIGIYTEISPDKLITLSSEYIFTYRTNPKIDSEPPTITFNSEGRIMLKKDSAAGIDIPREEERNSKFNYSSASTKKTSLEKYNLNSKKLYIKGQVEDGGSGPASLQWIIRNVDDEVYSLSLKQQNEITGQANLTITDSSTGTVEQEIDLTNEDFVEGMYELILQAYDANENKAEEKFYFVYDKTAPKPIVSDMKESRTCADKATVSNWASLARDIEKVEIHCLDYTTNVEVSTKTVDYNAASAELNNLIDQTKYKYAIYGIDYLGNKSATPVNFAPKYVTPSPENVSIGYDVGQVNFNIPAQSGISRYSVDYSLSEYPRALVYTGNKQIPVNDEISVDLYRRGQKYKFNIYGYDYSGNKSQATTIYTKDYIANNGNIVINDVEIPYTAMSRGITYQGDMLTINGDEGNPTGVTTAGAFPSGRKVKINPYRVGKYTVINNLYSALGGTLSSDSYTGDNYPLHTISVYRLMTFCNRLSVLLGYEPCYDLPNNTIDIDASPENGVSVTTSWNKAFLKGPDLSKDGFRFPTEAEWEAAARGVTPTKTDANWHYAFSGTSSLQSYQSYAWFSSNSSNHIHAVDENAFLPNGLGCYHMSGNVWELCADYFNTDVTAQDSTYMLSDYAVNPIGTSTATASATKIVRRGGYYGTNIAATVPTGLVTYRDDSLSLGAKDASTGLRLAQTTKLSCSVITGRGSTFCLLSPDSIPTKNIILDAFDANGNRLLVSGLFINKKAVTPTSSFGYVTELPLSAEYPAKNINILFRSVDLTDHIRVRMILVDSNGNQSEEYTYVN